jgi:hypothetical protein
MTPAYTGLARDATRTMRGITYPTTSSERSTNTPFRDGNNEFVAMQV